MRTDECSRWRRDAEEAARLGADRLEEWRTKFSVREKGPADLVTEADLASQKAIITYLQAQHPTHAFVGEEDGAAKGHQSLAAGASPTWIIDPLDGTVNYVHDCPAYCVSIGLLVRGELVVGVIFDPRLQEMFSAAKGEGATLNGKPIRVSATKELASSLLSTGFPPDQVKMERNLLWWRNFSFKAQALRRTGSTALNMAYVACGRFDGYWAFDNYAWDVAGGAVLIREAGGVVTQSDGSVFNPFKPDLLAANEAIHAAMLGELEQRS